MMDKLKKTFELEWDADCGEGWMNIFNLELCLFSKEHSKKELIKVTEVSNRAGITVEELGEVIEDISIKECHDILTFRERKMIATAIFDEINNRTKPKVR